MTLASDIEYYESQGWKQLNKQYQQTAQDFEKARKVYAEGVKKGILNPDQPDLPFKFTSRPWQKRSFTIEEVVRALILGEIITTTEKELVTNRLEVILTTQNPPTTAQYLKFR